MSYQVLARKWRPQTFRDLVGQEHVLQALVNALDRDRLHHAYLFTGTRGVGKTTIARILARCLNCDTGVSSEPCGQCSACLEITEGRFIDLIEVDAASRTKVEDTRELLDNVQYAPSRGRYKVYLIDEVHMLSNHSFNALLKTLEEPPPHVKFLLATTDPQKLPATVLSRCLQFNLKNLTAEKISGHLKHVLEQEIIDNEPEALRQIAVAAQGSMRDALSLTDQAIAFGSGKVLTDEVVTMLGSIDRGAIIRLTSTIVDGNAPAALSEIERLAEFGADYQGVLEALLEVFHKVALAQMVPETTESDFETGQQIAELASRIAPEIIQLCYQFAVNARRDMNYVPDPRSGLEMAVMRMIAFKPAYVPQEDDEVVPQQTGSAQQSSDGEQQPVKKPEPERTAPVATQAAPAPYIEVAQPAPVIETAPPSVIAAVSSSTMATATTTTSALDTPRIDNTQTDNASDQEALGANLPRTLEAALAVKKQLAPLEQPNGSVEITPVSLVSLQELSAVTWPQVLASGKIKGILGNIADNCVLESRDQNQLRFVLDQDQSSLFNEGLLGRLGQALSEYFGEPVGVAITVGEPRSETPARRKQRLHKESLVAAHQSLMSDANVIFMMDNLGAQLDDNSVESLRREEN